MKKLLVFLATLRIISVSSIIAGPDPSPYIQETMLEDQAGCNTIKQMMLTQKIIAEKTNLGKYEILDLSKQINNYALGCDHQRCALLCNVDKRNVHLAHERRLALGINSFLYSAQEGCKLTPQLGTHE
jgi:hypothetical protein